MEQGVLRWGFLGASRIGRSALAPAVLAAGHRLQAVAARDLARAEAFGAAFGATRAFGDYAALLDDPAVDAVYIALPNDLHLPWTLRALAAGKHVLCEKPLALNAAEVEQMRAAEAATGFRVMEAFCHRFHPQFDRIRALLAERAIGAVLAAQTHFVGPLTDPTDFRWTAAQGGGALFDLGCYGVSLLRGLFDREPTGTTGWAHPSGDVDAGFAAQLDFGAGLFAQLFCSFEGTRQQGLTLLGTEGRITVDWPFSTKGRETVLTCGDQVERFAPGDPYQTMVEHFARALAGRETMRFDLTDSWHQAQTLDRLRGA